jgi:hypothetical protein
MTVQIDEINPTDHVRNKANRLLEESQVDFIKTIGGRILVFWVLGDSMEVHTVTLQLTRKPNVPSPPQYLLQGRCPCRQSRPQHLCSHLYAAYLFAVRRRLV